MRKLATAGLAGLLLGLSACVSVTSAPAGITQLGGGQVTLGREWSDISQIMPARSKKVRLLSIDGPLLNRLYITEGLVAGDYMIRAATKEHPTPLIRSDMSVSEQIEFVADSVSAMDYQRVEASHPRPAKFGQAPGVRFDITALTKEGLEIKGLGAVGRGASGQLYVILYLAPAEHYFAATLPEAESVIASAQAG